MTDYEAIVIYAVRYTLGRMSYAVGQVCKYVTFERKKLSKECLNIIIRDIREGIELYHRSGHTCGMECDEKDWNNLLAVLEEEVRERE